MSAQFTASQDGPQPPVLCGTNSGYHMILDADMDCNSLTFTWSSTTDTRSWNIHISEILCSDPHKPPQGCLQYFTGNLLHQLSLIIILICCRSDGNYLFLQLSRQLPSCKPGQS